MIKKPDFKSGFLWLEFCLMMLCDSFYQIQLLRKIMQPLKYRRANTADIDHLVILINQAYRTNTGSSWTSEQDIVAGDRISHPQLLESFKQDYFSLFIAEISANKQSHVVACIGLTFQQNTVEIGTFCVNSDWQNQGIGKQVLEWAEKKALEIFPTLTRYEMFVLDARTELI